MKFTIPRDIAMMMTAYAITWIDRNSSFNLPSFIQSFLADLLCIPILLYVVLTLIRFVKNNDAFFFSLSHIVFSFVWVSCLCEIIIPTASDRYTADWLDVGMYALGSVYTLLRQKNWTTSSTNQNPAVQ